MKSIKINYRITYIEETIINTNIPNIQERRIIFTIGKNKREFSEIRVSTLILKDRPFRKDDISLKWFISGVGEDFGLVENGLPTRDFIDLVTAAKPIYKHILQSIVDSYELLKAIQ